MIPMNTWRRNPGKQTHDPIEASTWASTDGKTRREIEYIMIYRKYRNLTRELQVIHAWRGNMEQQRQHAVVKMEIRLHFERNFFQKTPTETGTDICYNIKQEIRKRELIAQHMGKNHISFKYQSNISTEENWNTAKQIPHEALTHVYANVKRLHAKTNLWTERI